MGLLARATLSELQDLAEPLPLDITVLREPEVGLVLVRGRIGGDGQPFNVGEATVTRAAVRLGGGEVGYGHVLGRAPERARLGAIVDALWQAPDHWPRIESGLVAIDQRLAAEADVKRRQVAATRVDFFTMVRGE